jgi:hypothetical protein
MRGDYTVIHEGGIGFVAVLNSPERTDVYAARSYVYERMVMAFWLNGEAAVHTIWQDSLEHLGSTVAYGDCVGTDVYLAPDWR